MAAPEEDVPGGGAVGSWLTLFRPPYLLYVLMLVGSVLLYASNTLLMATILPTALADIGGVEMLSWSTSFFMTASVISASAAAPLGRRLGSKGAFLAAFSLFTVGTLTCGLSDSMAMMLAGRFGQGLGGGLMSAMAYAMVSYLFPEALWARVFALLSGMWGIAALAGPLIGGVFASAGYWEGAFYSVAAAAALLTLAVAIALPQGAEPPEGSADYPAFRLGLIALGIIALSLAGIAHALFLSLALIAAGIGAFAAAIRLDRQAQAKLFPSTAFTLTGTVALGLWMLFLLSLANDPFPIYGPLFLQELHGLGPLAAGYLVASEAMAWTLVAAIVATLPARWEPRILILGPLAMALGLIGISWWMAEGPVAALPAPIFLAGGGIGACWIFASHAIMAGVLPGEETQAGAAIASMQIVGLGAGAALAGVVANMAGLSGGLTPETAATAATLVPGLFALAAIAASWMAVRMARGA